MTRAPAPVRMALLLGLVSALLVPGARAAAQAHYTGVAYRLGTDMPRYREEHWVFDSQGTRTRLVLYRCLDGAPFARKLLSYRASPWSPDFDFEDARSGYRESVHAQGAQLVVTVQRSAGKRPESADLLLRSDTVVDAGFDDFVREHWQAIEAPSGTTARFVVPSRLDDLRVSLRPDGDSPASSQYRQFRMALNGWLGAIAPTVALTYATADRRLLRFEGMSNIRDENGQTQRVRIVFPPEDDLPPASSEDIAAARNAPLVTRCAH